MEQVKCLKITCCLSRLPEVEDFIDKVVNEFSIDQEIYGNILISVTEAVTNAITHGNQSDTSKDVDLALENEGRKLSFKVKDQGPGFKFNELPDPTEPENILKIGGRGVFLMKNLCDQVLFSNGGSIVELQFKY